MKIKRKHSHHAQLLQHWFLLWVLAVPPLAWCSIYSWTFSFQTRLPKKTQIEFQALPSACP